MQNNAGTTEVKPEFQPSTESSSAEMQRLYYLQQLGIFSCYPRFVLPGALPSQACELPLMPALPAEHAIGTEPKVSSDAVATREPFIKAVSDLSTTQEKPGPKARQESKPAVAMENHEGRADPQFQMVLLQADKGLVICNQIPLLARQGLNDKEQHLLSNILQWLGCKIQTQSAPRRFIWPLPGLGGGSPAMAGKSLDGFLQQAQQELAFTSLLLMGSSGPECLEEFRRVNQTPAVAAQQVVTCSLAEMLALPELKRACWQQLLPLHARLTAQDV